MEQELMVDGFHRVLGETASEAGEGGMIGSEFVHGQLQELFEGAPIVDLGFQLGTGIDVKPLLQKQEGDGRHRCLQNSCRRDSL